MTFFLSGRTFSFLTWRTFPLTYKIPIAGNIQEAIKGLRKAEDTSNLETSGAETNVAGRPKRTKRKVAISPASDSDSDDNQLPAPPKVTVTGDYLPVPAEEFYRGIDIC